MGLSWSVLMDINLNDGLVSVLTIYELQNDRTTNHLTKETNSNRLYADRHINKTGKLVRN